MKFIFLINYEWVLDDAGSRHCHWDCSRRNEVPRNDSSPHTRKASPLNEGNHSSGNYSLWQLLVSMRTWASCPWSLTSVVRTVRRCSAMFWSWRVALNFPRCLYFRTRPLTKVLHVKRSRCCWSNSNLFRHRHHRNRVLHQGHSHLVHDSNEHEGPVDWLSSPSSVCSRRRTARSVRGGTSPKLSFRLTWNQILTLKPKIKKREQWINSSSSFWRG